MSCSVTDAQACHDPCGSWPAPWLWLVGAAVSATLLPLLLLGLTVIAVLCTVRPWDGRPNRTYSHLSLAPWPAFLLITWLRGLVQRLSELMLPAPARVAEMALGFMPSQVLLALVQLDIPNHLRKRGPQTAQQLAVACGAASVDQLARVLAAAHSLDLLGHCSGRTAKGAGSTGVGAVEGPVYCLNALSAVLCDGEKECMANLAEVFARACPAYCKLSEAITSGTPAFELCSGGVSFWDHMSSDTTYAQKFDAGMHESTRIMSHASIHDYPWGRLNTIIDVGGGKGGLTKDLLEFWPNLRGIVVDQPGQVERGQEWWSKEQPHLLHRVQFEAGDFFKASSLPTPPPGNTAYVLRNVLHDWPDAEAVMILKAVRQCIRQHQEQQHEHEQQQHRQQEEQQQQRQQQQRQGQVSLVILEVGSFERPNASFVRARRMGDIHMLVHFGGAKERNEAEFRALFAASGWRLQRVVPTRGLIFAIEAVPE